MLLYELPQLLSRGAVWLFAYFYLWNSLTQLTEQCY